MHTDLQLEIIDELLRKERGLVIRADGELELISGANLADYRDHWKVDSTLEFVGPGGYVEDPLLEWHDMCRTCCAAPAMVCVICAREGGAYCPHREESQMYCEHCAVVYPHVAAHVDEFSSAFMEEAEEWGVPRGLTRGHFMVAWASTGIGEAEPAELRLIAGFLHGWKLQDGMTWPLLEVQTH